MKPENCILCHAEKKEYKLFCQKCYEKADIFKKMKALRESTYFNNFGMLGTRNRRKRFYSSALSRYNTQEDE